MSARPLETDIIDAYKREREQCEREAERFIRAFVVPFQHGIACATVMAKDLQDEETARGAAAEMERTKLLVDLLFDLAPHLRFSNAWRKFVGQHQGQH